MLFVFTMIETLKEFNKNVITLNDEFDNLLEIGITKDTTTTDIKRFSELLSLRIEFKRLAKKFKNYI